MTVAGFTMVGTPARKAVESFSSIPHTGKVEGVDLDGHAFQRHADVATDERAALAQRLGAAVDVERLVGKLAATAARVREQRPDAAVDVDPGVAPASRPSRRRSR